MNRRSSYDAHEAMKRNESQSRIRFIRPSLSVDPEDLARQQDASAAVVRAAMTTYDVAKPKCWGKLQRVALARSAADAAYSPREPF